MRIGTSRAHGSLRTVVRLKSVPYDVERPSDRDKDRFGESGATTTTVTGIQMYLFEPQAVVLDTDFGDRLDGDLRGLALPSEDIQHQDRVTHQGDTYEISEPLHLPDNGNPVLKVFSLDKVTNQ